MNKKDGKQKQSTETPKQSTNSWPKLFRLESTQN
ncbi:hypothetical protein M2132_000841 [Dysgonomonas sp. PH5-45]|nr:hypothetical protein [Dysgonomonas sp. PH5-45]